jgi:hypothetical protein
MCTLRFYSAERLALEPDLEFCNHFKFPSTLYPVSMEAMRLEGWEDSRLESYQAGKLGSFLKEAIPF